MVWLVIFFYIFIYSFNSLADTLSQKEKKFFTFIDFNKDKNLSLEEINRSTLLFFNLIDKNQDGNLSEFEILELKNILEFL